MPGAGGGLGEIVGVAGVTGNGQELLGRVLAGVTAPASGCVLLDGYDVGSAGAPSVGFVAEQPFVSGCAPELSLLANLEVLEARRMSWLLRWDDARRRGADLLERCDVRPRDLELPAGALSGGNLQKLVVGRELARAPRLVVACYPTMGLESRRGRGGGVEPARGGGRRRRGGLDLGGPGRLAGARRPRGGAAPGADARPDPCRRGHATGAGRLDDRSRGVTVASAEAGPAPTVTRPRDVGSRLSSATAAALRTTGLAALLFLALASAFFLLVGRNPAAMFALMFQGSFGGGYALSETLVKTAPVLLCALATVLPARLGLISVGAEGQLSAGALAGTALVLAAGNRWGAFTRPAMLLAAAAGGAGLGALAGLLRARLRVNETISTLLLNYVAPLFVDYLVYGPWKDPQSLGWPSTVMFPEAARLPTFFGTRVHLGLFLGLGLVLGAHFILSRTRWGFYLDVLRSSPTLARRAGLGFGAAALMVMAAGAPAPGWPASPRRRCWRGAFSRASGRTPATAASSSHGWPAAGCRCWRRSASWWRGWRPRATTCSSPPISLRRPPT